MTLEKWALIATILVALITTASSTVSLIMHLQKNLRQHLSTVIKESENQANQREKDLKLWVKTLLESYYFPFDDRIKSLNERLKAIEKELQK